jgi:multisubunit Na+/H+ antiporter MnhB subunit
VLIGQADLLEDPFAPFVGFSGIAIIALGLVWDVLTFGPWVNRESPGLPRASRLFIYIGYGLVGVTLINWSLTAHVLSELEYYTGGGALQGFSRFGTPLLYVVFGVVLAAVVRERRQADDDAAAA